MKVSDKITMSREKYDELKSHKIVSLALKKLIDTMSTDGDVSKVWVHDVLNRIYERDII